MIRAGIVGAAGYAGGEAMRILLNHPDCDLVYALSQSQSGKQVHEVYPDLLGQSGLTFQASSDLPCDVLFLCGGHGKSKNYLSENPQRPETIIIDLSRDFRLTEPNNDFVYGLTELNRTRISRSSRIANPGCFATCIQLALIPLAHHQHLKSEIHITAITGSTGAGQQPVATTHFSWRNNNVSVYKAFKHQHLTEVWQTLQQLQPDYDASLNFIPIRGNFSRGILASIYLDTDLKEDHITEMYHDYFAPSPFVHVVNHDISLKNVVNTNHCFIQVKKYGNKLHLISILDNLLKGASGQAVQNMNLIFSLEEDAGLKLKASVY